VQSNIKGLIAPWPHRFRRFFLPVDELLKVFISDFSHTADN